MTGKTTPVGVVLIFHDLRKKIHILVNSNQKFHITNGNLTLPDAFALTCYLRSHWSKLNLQAS